MRAAQFHEFLTGLTHLVADAVCAGNVEAQTEQVAAQLVAANVHTPAALRHTLEVFTDAFLEDVRDDLGDNDDIKLRARMTEVICGLSAGFAAALQERTRAEQEQLQRAALHAMRAAERDRRAVEARFRAVFDDAAVGIGMVNLSGQVTDVNTAFARMLGYPPELIRERTVTELVAADGDSVALASYRQLLSGQRDHFRAETIRHRPDGTRLVLDLSMSVVRDGDGAPSFLIGVAADITERRRLQDRLWHESRHDALTRLPNRTLFFEQLTQRLDDPAQSRLGLSFLDLDGFKDVNDSLGHDVGDQLLIAVARRLEQAAQAPGWMVARLGGDEFVVLTDVTNDADIVQPAEAILAALASPVTVGGRELTVSASIGVVDSHAAGTDPQQLMRLADITLYRAKANGKGRIARYDPRGSARQITRHTLATTLPAALARGEFFCEYQPIIGLADRQLRGVEALVRWRHPQLGVVAPNKFIPVAEETGHIAALGRLVLAQACQQLTRWSSEHPNLLCYISVNVSVAQLRDPNLASTVLQVLEDTGLPTGRLQLELTESAILGDGRGSAEQLNKLADAGVRLAIDDFGTGYANLAYLTRLPVRQLKIAGEFLKPLRIARSINPKHHIVLSSIISLAHNLGLSVTAEGVEHEAQAKRLHDLGCDAAQGWLFARPGPPDTMQPHLPKPNQH